MEDGSDGAAGAGEGGIRAPRASWADHCAHETPSARAGGGWWITCPPMPACTFCDIVAGARPAYVVLDVPDALAFLDARPLFAGHTLLVPKAHHETMLDVPADLLATLAGEAKRLAAAMESALGSQGSFVAINNRVSQSVAHLHVHVVPRTKGDGLRGFFWPRTTYASDAEAGAVAARLREALS